MFILQGGKLDDVAATTTNLGGGTTVTVRNIQIHQDDIFDAAGDFFNAHPTAGHGGGAVATVAVTSTRLGITGGARYIPFVNGGLAVTSVIADCRRVSNTPSAGDTVESRLRARLEQQGLTQEQLTTIITAANDPNFNRDTFRQLLLDAGIPAENQTIQVNGRPVVLEGADALANAVRDNRQTLETREHNRNVNIGCTAAGVAVGVLAVVAISCCWNPVGWGAAAAIGVVCACAAIGNWVGSWFRR